MNVPGAGQNRGDVDFVVAQRDEVESYSDTVDRGSGKFSNPVAGGSASSRGRCVHLPDFNVPSSGVLNVHQLSSVEVLGKDPADVEAIAQTMLEYRVPATFGLRITTACAFPRDLGLYPFVDSSWTIEDDAIMGFDRRSMLGTNSVDQEHVSIFVPGGKTLRVKVYTRLDDNIGYVIGFNGYLFTERY